MKLNKNPNTKKKIGSGWVQAPGPFLIENINLFDIGVGGWCELYLDLFWMSGIFLTLQGPLLTLLVHTIVSKSV